MHAHLYRVRFDTMNNDESTWVVVFGVGWMWTMLNRHEWSRKRFWHTRFTIYTYIHSICHIHHLFPGHVDEQTENVPISLVQIVRRQTHHIEHMRQQTMFHIVEKLTAIYTQTIVRNIYIYINDVFSGLPGNDLPNNFEADYRSEKHR